MHFNTLQHSLYGACIYFPPTIDLIFIMGIHPAVERNGMGEGEKPE